MFKERSHHILLFCSVVTVATAVLQYLYPHLILFDGGLIAAVLLTVFLKQDLYTRVFGLIGIGLSIISVFYDSSATGEAPNLLQHLFSLAVLVLTVFFVLYVKKLYRSIELDQQQFKALFDHATEGIILTDREGEIVIVNPSGAALFGYDQNELEGQSIDILIPQRFHGRHAKDRTDYYEHPGNRSMGQGRELFALKKDGTEFPVEVSLSHYRQVEGVYVVAFVIDISQRKQSERDLIQRQGQLETMTRDMRQLNNELEVKVEQRTAILREALQELNKSQEELNAALSKEKELNEIKSRFVSMASHEFRTPLSTILSSANLLSRYTGGDEQEKRDKHIRRTRDAVKHLNNLLDDFLSLGRLEEGRVRLEISDFMLGNFMDEIVEDMRSIARAGQKIGCQCPAQLSIRSDQRLLRNVLINLLSNAIKFSPEHSEIQLQCKLRDDSLLRFVIRDGGIGISAEDQQNLFARFFRGANVQNIEGTGLGLHIVQRYLGLLQGTIHISSVLGAGTEVTVELPLAIWNGSVDKFQDYS